MESLHNHLPKDLVAIVEEYSKDRTIFDRVMIEYYEKSCEAASTIINCFCYFINDIHNAEDAMNQICDNKKLYDYFVNYMTWD